jgi:hypothetical protein
MQNRGSNTILTIMKSAKEYYWHSEYNRGDGVLCIYILSLCYCPPQLSCKALTTIGTLFLKIKPSWILAPIR